MSFWNLSSAMAGGKTAPTFLGGNQYAEGSPGSSYLPPGTACPESVAMEAGSAVTYVGADKKCQRVQGIKIIIGDTAMSNMEGFTTTNMNFSCSGQQPCCHSNLTMNAPVLA